MLLGAPVTPVPRAGSLWGALWPDVAGARSLVIGVWLWADAVPLETSRTAAANNAECFLMVCSFVAPILNVLIEAMFQQVQHPSSPHHVLEILLPGQESDRNCGVASPYPGAAETVFALAQDAAVLSSALCNR